MKKIVTIGNREISIRGVKFKEIKELAASCGERVERILSVMDEDDFLSALNSALVSNLDEVERLLGKYTDLSPEEIGDLELADLTQLVKELLSVNGIDGKKVADFFTGIARLLREGESRPPENVIPFVEKVPEIG